MRIGNARGPCSERGRTWFASAAGGKEAGSREAEETAGVQESSEGWELNTGTRHREKQPGKGKV